MIKPDCLWDEIALAGKELCRKKQLDYGPHSISNTGDIGVAVRLNDKVTRLLNLIKKFDGAGDKDSTNFESVKDTYIDIMNYAIIGLLLMDDKWADKVHMDKIFGGEPTPIDPAIPGMSSYVKLEWDGLQSRFVVDEDCENPDEPLQPWHPLFDWSPYIGEYVQIKFSDYVVWGIINSIGPKRKFITINGARYSVGGIVSIDVAEY